MNAEEGIVVHSTLWTKQKIYDLMGKPDSFTPDDISDANARWFVRKEYEIREEAIQKEKDYYDGMVTELSDDLVRRMIDDI